MNITKETAPVGARVLVANASAADDGSSFTRTLYDGVILEWSAEGRVKIEIKTKKYSTWTTWFQKGDERLLEVLSPAE